MSIKPILSQDYVKFVRGTSEQYAQTVKDAGTLYFIINPGDTKGSLYLGEKLIASGMKDISRLQDLDDVTFNKVLQAGDIFSYNGTNWEAKSLSDIIPGVMQGASAEADGLGGLVPMPEKGEQAFFLRGDGEWANPTAAIETTLEELSSTVGSHTNAISGMNTILDTLLGGESVTSIKSIVSSEIAKLVNDSEENPIDEKFDTLKEIADWILSNDGTETVVELSNKVSALDNLLNGTEAKTDEDGNVLAPAVLGLVDRVEAVEEFKTSAGEAFDSIFAILGDSNSGLVKQVNQNSSDISDLDNRMRWSVLEADDEEVNS